MMKKKSRLRFIVTCLVMKKIMSAEASGNYCVESVQDQRDLIEH